MAALACKWAVRGCASKAHLDLRYDIARVLTLCNSEPKLSFNLYSFHHRGRRCEELRELRFRQDPKLLQVFLRLDTVPPQEVKENIVCC